MIKYINIFFLTFIINFIFINNTLASDSNNFDSNNLDAKLAETEQDIKNIDGQISKKVKLLNSINKYINTNNKKQAALKKEQQSKQAALDQYKQQLLVQLKTTYIINRNNHLKNITNLNEPSQLNRLLNYMKELNNFNNDNINKIRETLQNLETLNNEIEVLNTQQTKYKHQVEESYHNLKELKQHNLKLKEELQNKIDNLASEAQYNKSNHDKLLNSIPNYKESFYKQANSISKYKGKLLLPVSGIINANYKSLNSHKAIFIQTDEGSNVKAIFNGQVVFSNWLRGFGFLTIVNHGDGYMSLYGQNQTLLKKQGDIIEAGEIIALTGSSGGNDETGLYFEIRHNGVALNPLAWLTTDLKSKV